MLILSRRMKSPRPTLVCSAMVMTWVTLVTDDDDDLTQCSVTE